MVEVDRDVHLLPEVKERYESWQEHIEELVLAVIRFTNEVVLRELT